MMSFLAKALQNPQFLQQVLQPRAPSRITSGDLTWAPFSHVPGLQSSTS